MAQAAIDRVQRMTADERRAEIAQMLVRDRTVTQAVLAGRYGVSITTIAKDIRLIRDEWRDARLASADVMISQDLAELSMVKQAAWRVYADSLGTKWSRTEQSTVSTGGQGAGETDTTSQTEAKANPNLKALELVTKCIDKKQNLLGYGEGAAEKKRDKQRLFAFTVKIGDKVLAAQSSDLEEEEIVAEDAEYYEVGPDGKKLLLEADNEEGGGVQ